MKLLVTIILSTLCVLCSLVIAQSREEGELAISADSFVNSIGVNIHLHHTDTPYANFAQVKRAIEYLGVRHVRDGLIDTTWTPYYDHLNELGRAGIKATLITSPKQSEALLTDYPGRVPDAFEAYEAPNEYDQSGDKNWPVTLNSFVAKLHQVVKSNPQTAAFPIVGPSLTQAVSFDKVATSLQFIDFANLHNYFGGRNPGTPGWGANGYGSYSWNLDLARHAWPGKPIISTETGYFNDLSKPNSVPEEIAGKYLPRLLFEQTLHAIERTYIYELVDTGRPGQPGDTTYGLLHADFTPKPAFTAIRNILHLLADPGPEFRPGRLNFHLAGDLAGVHHLLLEKRNGTFFLAIWNEQSSYEVDSQKILEIHGREISMQTAQPAKFAPYQLDETGSMHASAPVFKASYRFTVTDRVAILQISPQNQK